MGTRFDIGCCTCRVASGVVHPHGSWTTGVDELRSPDDLHEIIKAANGFAIVGVALKTVYIRGTGCGDPLETFAKYFAAHPNHEFLVEDEYGYEWPLVQAYDGDGKKLGPPRAHRLETSKPGYSAKVTNVR